MIPTDCNFNLVINKGALDCVMCYSDQIERRMNMYRNEVVSKKDPFLLMLSRPLVVTVTLGHLIDRHPRQIQIPPI